MANQQKVPIPMRHSRSPRGSASSLQLGAELASAGFGTGSLSPNDQVSTLSRRQQQTLGVQDVGAYDDLHSAVGALESKIWYHGELSREETASRLMGTGSMRRAGYFLVRRGRAGVILSVAESGGIRHYVIQEHTRSSSVSCFSIDDGPRFPSVPGLISFYRSSTDPLPIKLSSHCPNRSVSAPHVMFGRYGVAWMSAGKDQDQAQAIVEGEFAQAIYDTVKPSMRSPAKPQAGAAKNKFIAAARAIQAAKKISWNATRDELMQSIRPEELEADKPVNPKTQRGDFHHRTIKQSTVIESKVYLSWLNKKLTSAGISIQVTNLFSDLRTAEIPIQVVHILTGVSKPRYKENPTTEVQMQDNWHALIKFMKRASVPTTKLDADALYKQDQRMILKFFSLLLRWEAKQALEESKGAI